MLAPMTNNPLRSSSLDENSKRTEEGSPRRNHNQLHVKSIRDLILELYKLPHSVAGLPVIIKHRTQNTMKRVDNADPVIDNTQKELTDELLRELSSRIELPTDWDLSPEWRNNLGGEKTEELKEENPPSPDQKRAKSDSGSGSDVPTTGIKLSYLLSVLMSRLRTDDSLTVEDFLKTLKEELNAEAKVKGEMLFLKFLQEEKKGRLVVGAAQVYVVCDSQSDIRDVLTSLQEYFRTTPDIFVCMDGITHHAPIYYPDQNFDAVVQEIGRMVLVTSKWRDMENSVLKDSRVLYEVYCAIKGDSKCKFDLALSLDECSLIKEEPNIKNRVEDAMKTIPEDFNLEAAEKIVGRFLDLLDFPKGIKLSYLLSVVTDEKKFSNVSIRTKKDGKETLSTLQLNDLTMDEFLDQCLKPILMTKSRDIEYFSDYLQTYPPNNEKLVDYAEAYITCPMTSNFLTTMNTLKDHFNNKPDTYVSIEKITRKTAAPSKVPSATQATHQCQKCMKKSKEEGQADIKSAVADLQKAETDKQKAEADLQRAEADLQRLKADQQPGKADIKTAEADLRKSKADLQKAEADKLKAKANQTFVLLDSVCAGPGGGSHCWLALPSSPVPNITFSIDEFQDRIRRIHNVVVVMSPWNNLGFLKRTALLYEIYLAKKYDCTFDIALGWYDKKRLIEFFRRGEKREIERALEGIDIEKSACNLISMKDAILDAVKGDYAGANAMIKDVLITHLTCLTGHTKGIKLSHLFKVFHSMSKEMDENANSKTVKDFMKSLKDKLGGGTLYMNYLENHFPSVTGPGQVYVSYESTALFYNTLETLRQHFEKDPDIYVCLDNITHRAP
eukprot:gene23605-30607_t